MIGKIIGLFLTAIIVFGALYVLVNRGLISELAHDFEVVCLNEFHLNEEEHWARDIGISVDGRLAYSTYNVDWYWADTREPIERFSSLWWALHDLTEGTYPTVILPDEDEEGEEGEEEIKLGPNPPPCVTAKMNGEPCEDCE